jgi:hypothetical protein
MEPETEYRITLQRDLNLTIHDPGAVTVILPLNNEQLMGISLAIDILVTGPLEHNFTRNLDIVRLSNNQVIGTDYMRHNIHFLGAKSVYFDISDTYHQSIRGGNTPSTFLNSLNLLRHQTLAYWCLFQQRLSPLWALMVGIQFETPSFLQGAITGLNWFGKNWRDHIILIHHHDQLEEIVGFA